MKRKSSSIKREMTQKCIYIHMHWMRDEMYECDIRISHILEYSFLELHYFWFYNKITFTCMMKVIIYPSFFDMLFCFVINLFCFMINACFSVLHVFVSVLLIPENKSYGGISSLSCYGGGLIGFGNGGTMRHNI